MKYDTHGISSYDSTSELLFHKVGIIKVKKTLLLQKVSIANPEKRTEGRKELSPMPANANEFQEGLSFFLNVARSVQYRALCFPGKIIRSGNRESGPRQNYAPSIVPSLQEMTLMFIFETSPSL